ncbi:hypothetical protein LUZ60_003691 [Juncus effusus]|nr:hypothetical protein LUZ60_003691 [Juncus effusus]
MASFSSICQSIPAVLPFRTFSVNSRFHFSFQSHWKAGAFSNDNPVAQDDESNSLPKEFYDDEWQAKQREKTKEWQAYKRKVEEEEERKTNEYREIGMRLKGYPDDQVRKARILVSDLIGAGELIEESIEEAAERGELTELVLLVIWNRLDVARRDEETDVIRSLDLLYRRIETEILKRESTPSMRLLNELLNLHDGFDDSRWIKECRKIMLESFPREDPFSIIVPPGVDFENSEGRMEMPAEDDKILLRVDFIREVDSLLKEIRSEQDEINKSNQGSGFDPESVAARFKQQEKQRIIGQVEKILEVAVSLKWY